MLRIGTAGSTIPGAHSALAPGPGSHLERYARILNCVEINSTFYRSHRPATWRRWASSTPQGFRFSVKLPKSITHTARLCIAPHALDPFLSEVSALGDKLGPILVQLPPSLNFHDSPAAEFFEALRDRWTGPIAVEARHASWFTCAATDILLQHRIARVAADPSHQPDAVPGQVPHPGGWPGLAYFRLHGSPRMYYSNYDSDYLAALASAIADQPAGADTWVIFDNTASGHAFANANELHLHNN